MSKLYNTIDSISSDLFDFLSNSFKSNNVKLSKPNITNLSHLIISAINSESVVTADLAANVNSNDFSNNLDSIQKRFWRFFNNPNIDIYSIFDSIIRSVINNISNVRHDELFVTLDHMYTKNNFVTLMFTLRIDKQGIPIWFRTERTLSNCHIEIQKNSRKKLFKEKFIIDAINDVIDILSPLNTKITFLADRWFFNLNIAKHINDSGHFFCFRAKANANIKFLFFDKKEGHEIYKRLSDLRFLKNKSVYYNDLELGSMKFKCNLTISRRMDDDMENWYIITNLDPHLAVKKYSKRYGSIEMFFKSQKTNGFYLESTKTKNLHAFETLYGVICIASLWLNILGNNYIKNYNHLKKWINIRFNKRSKSGALVRILSTFKLGLTLFKKVFNSHINYCLKFNFKLYL